MICPEISILSLRYGVFLAVDQNGMGVYFTEILAEALGVKEDTDGK